MLYKIFLLMLSVRSLKILLWLQSLVSPMNYILYQQKSPTSLGTSSRISFKVTRKKKSWPNLEDKLHSFLLVKQRLHQMEENEIIFGFKYLAQEYLYYVTETVKYNDMNMEQ